MGGANSTYSKKQLIELNRTMHRLSDLVTDKDAAKLQKAILKQYSFLDSIWNSVLVTDLRLPDNPIVYASDEFERMTLYSKEEILGRNCRFLQGRHTNKNTVKKIREAVELRTTFECQLLNYRADGTPFANFFCMFPVRLDGKGAPVTHYIAVQNDVTIVNLRSVAPVDWTATEVALWLDEQDHLAEISPAFVERGIDGSKLLAITSKDDFMKLGMDPFYWSTFAEVTADLRENANIPMREWAHPPGSAVGTIRSATNTADNTADDSADSVAFDGIDQATDKFVDTYKDMAIVPDDAKIGKEARYHEVWKHAMGRSGKRRYVFVKVTDGTTAVMLKVRRRRARLVDLLDEVRLKFRIPKDLMFTLKYAANSRHADQLVQIDSSEVLNGMLRNADGTVLIHIHKIQPDGTNSERDDFAAALGLEDPDSESTSSHMSTTSGSKKHRSKPSTSATEMFLKQFNQSVFCQFLVDPAGRLLLISGAAADTFDFPAGPCPATGVTSRLLGDVAQLANDRLMPKNDTALSHERALRALAHGMHVVAVRHYEDVAMSAGMMTVIDLDSRMFLVHIMPIDPRDMTDLEDVLQKAKVASEKLAQNPVQPKQKHYVAQKVASADQAFKTLLSRSPVTLSDTFKIGETPLPAAGDTGAGSDGTLDEAEKAFLSEKKPAKKSSKKSKKK